MIYPAEGEVIDSSGCRFLIDAPESRVEIAVDGGPWDACRLGGGYWWYDRVGLGPGRHQAMVRCDGSRGGEPVLMTLRFCVADAPSPA